MSAVSLPRRDFLRAGSFSLAALALSPGVDADELPPPASRRATDGDDRAQPNWEEQLTITVGQSKGDLVGRDDRALQAAVDYVARLGGGTVKILPGVYTLRNSIFLPSKIRIVGSGAESIITKIASETIPLSDDSDWYDQEITLAKKSGFRVGDGVTLEAVNADNNGRVVIKRTLVARSGNRFRLSDGLRENLWLAGKPTCTSVFPLFTSERTADVLIENLTLDGNKENNAHLNGNYAGCVFLQDCNRYTLRGVEARNYNGDGISFQICHDVVIENCHSHDHTHLGLHPGSGSQRPILRGNKLERNNLGLYWCWGVKHGLAENNTIDGNRSYGISIGHNDTDNIMRNNVISNSGKVGILFRDDTRGKDFWANRNLVENNRILNSGDETGVAIDIRGNTKEVVIADNEIRETRQPMKRIGVRIDKLAGKITLTGNRIHGFAHDIVDARTA